MLRAELSETEKNIGKRLREFRESLKIPRTAFALVLGISSERLASYEAGRVPLRWDVFSAISKHFFLNPFWLATGATEKFNPRLETPFDESSFDNIDPRSLFTDTMLYIIKDAGPEDFQTLAKITRAGNLLTEVLSQAKDGGLSKAAGEKLAEMADVWREVAGEAAKKVQKHEDRRQAVLKTRRSDKK
jgi:transcriptional regulator with XRE-family HTH domain